MTIDVDQPRQRLRRAALALALGLLVPVLAGSAVRTVNEVTPSVESPADPQLSRETVPDVALETAPAGDIHALSLEGETEAVLALLDAEPDRLETRDGKGMTPLALAAWGVRMPLLEALLARGADPDALNDNGLTPLFCALDRGNRGVAVRLAVAGADLQVKGYRGWTLLHAAVRAGDLGFVRRLLAAGLDPNAVTTLGRTPLHFAERFQDTAIVAELTAAGAVSRPNPRPWTTWPIKNGKKLLYKR